MTSQNSYRPTARTGFTVAGFFARVVSNPFSLAMAFAAACSAAVPLLASSAAAIAAPIGGCLGHSFLAEEGLDVEPKRDEAAQESCHEEGH